MKRVDKWFITGYLLFIVTVGAALATSPGLHGKVGNIVTDGAKTTIKGFVVNNTAITIGASADTLTFYGGTPIVREPANADTTGATLANLEIEVNQLKQLLRNYNLMAP